MNKNTRLIVLLVVLLVVLGAVVFAFQWNQVPAPQAPGTVASTTLPLPLGAQSAKPVTTTGTHAPGPVVSPKILYPTLSKVTPSSGPTGTFVSIYGSGFNATSQVLIGAGAISHPTVNSTGTMLTFTMPSSVGAYCKAGQACPLYALLLQPGTYQLSIENDDGSKSSSFPFVLTASAS